MNLQGIDGMTEVSGVCYFPEDVTKGGQTYYRGKIEAGLLGYAIDPYNINTNFVQTNMDRMHTVKRLKANGKGYGIRNDIEDLCGMLGPKDLREAVRRSRILC